MKRLTAYNLVSVKNEFIKELERAGFQYGKSDGMIIYPTGSVVGRILDSSPPFLVIPGRFGGRTQREGISKLKRLAEDFGKFTNSK